ncbi:ATP-binding protein [Sandarakinorhabdus oryzae]|uniref:ATP-binding protein n=1 Tax=Sandarakinorhabdus oryzae TaxID=2675220 RepID=UPI0012E2B07C|nr:ATP-binding protein [Sandarakinorhabdus oryzae]
MGTRTSEPAIDLADRSLARIIDTVSDAVIVADDLGRILIFNTAASQLFGVSRNAVLGTAITGLLPQATSLVDGAAAITAAISAADGRTCQIEMSRQTLASAERPLHTFTLRDVSAAHLARAQLARINRLQAALAQIHRAIGQGGGRQAVLVAVCRALVEQAGLCMAWIGWLSPESGTIVPVADYGDDHGYLQELRIFTDERWQGKGPTGTAFRENRAVVFNNLISDFAGMPWQPLAIKSGFCASAAFPVRVGDRLVGTLSVYAGEPGWFREQEVALLAGAANDIAQAIAGFQREDSMLTAEQIVRRERSFSESMIQGIPGSVYLFNEQGRFLRWNRNLETVTGYSAAEIAAMHPEDIFPVTEKPAQREAVARAFATGSATLEANLLTRDGRLIPHFFTGQRVMFEGQPHLVGVGVDVSDLRAARDALKETERRHRATLDTILEACQLVDFEQRYRYLNHAAVVQNRRPAAELLGRTMTECWPGVEDHELHAMMRQCLEQRVEVQSEISFTYPDGDNGRFDVRMVPDPEGAIMLSIDITGQHAAREELLRLNAELEARVAERTRDLQAAVARAETSDRTKSTFLATMSHELRTPLNSIIGFTGIISQGLAGPLTAEQAKQLGMVRSSARHLLELVNDVLDISKIEAGELDIFARPFDLRTAVDRTVTLLAPAAEAKALRLSVHWDLADTLILSDQRRIEQILINLVNNAIKFTEAGAVRIELAALPDDRIEIRVVDTGIGIDLRDMDTLFQPFRQIDSGLARQHEGTGLGLAICRRLLDFLGGSITVESRIGHGTMFTINLPRRLELAAEDRHPTGIGALGGGRFA